MGRWLDGWMGEWIDEGLSESFIYKKPRYIELPLHNFTSLYVFFWSIEVTGENVNKI